MSMVLTQTYLEPQQKKSLAEFSKATGRKVSDLMRDAVDSLLLGVNPEELKQLDSATRHASVDIKAMIQTLDENAAEHHTFMAQMQALQAQAKNAP
jgi:phage tail tape-measure protein